MHCDDSRLAIFSAAGWLVQGRPKNKSPIPALMAKFGCERTYPKKLYDRVVKHGTVESNWSGGRPAEFSPRCWEAMITIIRLHRTKHRVASSRNVSADLKKVPGRKRKKAPSANTVLRAKKTLRFKKHKVHTKPKLNTHLWATRVAMAKARMMSSEAAYINTC